MRWFIFSRFRLYVGVWCWLCSITGLQLVNPAILSLTIEPKSSVFVQRNHEFTINCSATGIPTPNVSWKKNGTVLVSSREVNVTKRGLHFLHGVRESRTGSARIGIFRCLAKNSAGVFLSQKISVNVIYLRNISLSLHPAVVGNTARLQCKVLSNRPVNFKWFRNNQLITTTPDARITVVPSGALQIRHFTSSDNGEYVCRAENEYEGITSLPLQVVKQAPTTSRLDIYPSKAVNITLGRRLLIECWRTGINSSNLSWSKISRSQKDTPVLASGVNFVNLVFDTVRISDGGEYVCQGVDGVREKVAVFVQVPPSFSRKRPAKLDKGDKLILECEPKGNPTPSLTWYINGRRVVEGGRFRFVRDKTVHKLIIGKVTLQDDAVYQCEAENELGSSIESTVLVVKEMIDPPTNVQARVLSATEIQVTWSSPSGYKGRTAYYSVHYADAITHEEKQMTTTEQYYTIEHLQEYTEYLVYVSATFALPMKYSKFVIVRTLEKEPSGPPLNVHLKSYTRGTLDITWLPPTLDERNGNVTGYAITCYSEAARQLLNITVGKNSYSFTFTKLAQGKTYFVKVAARTSKGLGPFSEELSLVVAKKSPTGVILPAPAISTKLANGSIVVSVKPPVNANVRGYHMSYGNMSVLYTKVEISTRTFEYILKDLEVNSEYVINVTAKGPGVVAARPAIAVVWTKMEYPVPKHDNKTISNNGTNYGLLLPNDLTCDHAKESTALVLTWKRPTWKKDIIRYRIKYSAANSDARPRVRFTSHLNITLSGLLPGNEYNVEIQSRVVSGSKTPVSGPATAQISTKCFLPEKKPDTPPSFLTCDATSVSSIVVKWRPPTRPNGKITKYGISWRNSVNEELLEEYPMIGSGDRYTMTLRDVRKDPRYVISVYAVNSAGISPKANCSINTTMVKAVSTTQIPSDSNDDIKLGIIIGCIISLLFVICLAIFIVWHYPCGCHRSKPLTQMEGDMEVETSVGLDNQPRYRIPKPDTNNTEVSDASSKQYQIFQKYILEESSKESDRGLGMTPKNSHLCLDNEKIPFINKTQQQDYSTGASFDSQDSGIQGLDKLGKGSSSSSSTTTIKDSQKQLLQSKTCMLETAC